MKDILKAVIDTNVLVSAVLMPGPSFRILYHWHQEDFALIITKPIFQEYARVLLREKFHLPVSIVNDILSEIHKKSHWVKPRLRLKVVYEDESDNRFLEAAVSGKADYIVTQDKHLLILKKFEDISIITPVEFLKQLR